MSTIFRFGRFWRTSMTGAAEFRSWVVAALWLLRRGYAVTVKL